MHPVWVHRQPACDGVDEAGLEVERGSVPGDPDLTEPLEHCADVLMLELEPTRPSGR
jgi:hypothetical protein